MTGTPQLPMVEEMPGAWSLSATGDEISATSAAPVGT
jgi:hypothetical protein